MTDAIGVSISDRGEGISAMIDQHLLAPFRSSKRQGLVGPSSICRSLVEANGGRLWHSANPGGTTKLPLHDGHGGGVNETAAATVFLIDDDIAARDSLATLLHTAGLPDAALQATPSFRPALDDEAGSTPQTAIARYTSGAHRRA